MNNAAGCGTFAAMVTQWAAVMMWLASRIDPPQMKLPFMRRLTWNG